MCWNEEPHKRPNFTELRSKFDTMLLAERKDTYIDLHIDSDKPYYRLDTTEDDDLQLSQKNPSCHSLMPSIGSNFSSRKSSKESSPNPIHTPNFSPTHKSLSSRCSMQTSPRKPGHATLTPSLSSFGGKSPRHYTLDSPQRGRSNSHEPGRPVSMLVPDNRERREKLVNPYVEEPSRVGVASFVLSEEGGRRVHGESIGAMEMHQVESGQILSPGIEITISDDQT